jgi:hypothetical protein
LEDQKFKVSLGYIVRLSLNKQTEGIVREEPENQCHRTERKLAECLKR